MVPVSTLLACIATLCVCLFLPIAVLILFAVKYKGEKILPAWLLGAAGFFVTQMLIRLPILTILQNQSWFVSFSRKRRAEATVTRTGAK